MTRLFRLVAVAAVMAPLAACSNSAPTDPTDATIEARRTRLLVQETSVAEPAVSFRPRTTGGGGGRAGRR